MTPWQSAGSLAAISVMTPCDSLKASRICAHDLGRRKGDTNGGRQRSRRLSWHARRRRQKGHSAGSTGAAPPTVAEQAWRQMLHAGAGQRPALASSVTPVQLRVHSSGSQAPVASANGQMTPVGSSTGLEEGPNSVPACAAEGVGPAEGHGGGLLRPAGASLAAAGAGAKGARPAAAAAVAQQQLPRLQRHPAAPLPKLPQLVKCSTLRAHPRCPGSE